MSDNHLNQIPSIIDKECDIFEGITSVSAVIRSISEGLSDRRIYKVLFAKSKIKSKSRELGFIKIMSEKMNFEISYVDISEINILASGETHGGIIALCSKRTFNNPNVNFLTNGNFFALIDGIEDPYNFGYSVRSLYAAGVDGIILPERNWMDYSGVVARSSAGTSELANICVADTVEAIKMFKEHNFQIVCAGIRDSLSIYDYDFNKPILLVVGGEKRGISRKILDLADSIVRIDYGRDFMGSLPAASAISVIAFEISRQKHR